MLTSEIERKYVIEGITDSEKERISFAIENMKTNRAFMAALRRNPTKDASSLLKEFQDRFLEYRKSWRENPQKAIQTQCGADYVKNMHTVPLCVDIETAAVCDLACPFCYRQYIVTPDKLIDSDFCFDLIDQCAELGVPSIKLNWRGEPLMHPKLSEFVAYAKDKGILETIINTNAVTLNEKKARALIEAGLDLIIYSFDGGTKETYEKMRPGRFQKNSFDAVYANIKRFHELKQEMNSVWPRTKIQMVVTKETFPEQDSFKQFFHPYVDDVSFKAYTERGGKLADIDDESKKLVEDHMRTNGLKKVPSYWRNIQGNLYVAEDRVPCEQPFQRLLVTYDGRVSMCCYDWGSQHPIGYASDRVLKNGDVDYEDVLAKAKTGKPGFELLQKIEMPKIFSRPEPKVSRLKEIWQNQIVSHVRQKQVESKLDQVNICRECTFKETYKWKQLK